MNKISLWVIALLCVSVFFFSACSNQVDDVVSNQLEDVSKVSLQRLAEMQSDQTVPQELYDDIEKMIYDLRSIKL